MQMTAVLTPAPEGGYTAINPETGTTSQGETVDEALANAPHRIGNYFGVPAVFSHD